MFLYPSLFCAHSFTPFLLVHPPFFLSFLSLSFSSSYAHSGYPIKNYLLLFTFYPASTIAINKPKASLEATAVAVTELTETVTAEGRAGTLTPPTRVFTCTFLAVVTSPAFTAGPNARAETRVTPL